MKASAIVLTTAARSAIVSAFVAALNTAENTGGLVHTVCEVVSRATKGNALSDADSKAIVTDISRAKGWKGDSAKARESEVRVVLKASDKLPDAIEAFRAKTKGCTWHNSMSLARSINKGKTIPQAVTLVANKSPGANGTPEGRVAGALKAWHKASPRKRDAIVQAAAILNIKLGIKLDA